MKVNWLYDACGEHFVYKGFVVIKQDHPALLKYEICTWNQQTDELHHQGVADTLKAVKDTINDLIKKQKAK